MLFVSLIDGDEALALAGLEEQPKIGESSQTGTRNVMQTPALEVRQQVVDSCQTQQNVGSVFYRNQHGGSVI